MNKRNLVFGLVFTLLVSLLAVPAVADTHTVGSGGYSSITEALAAANPGDTIEVNSGYDSSNEKFPILVQKDGITIEGNNNLIEDGVSGSMAIFTVGALKGYDSDDPNSYEPTTYRDEVVQNVTIRNFKIFDDNGDGTTQSADVAFVLSNVSDVTIESNSIDARDSDDTLLQGIRLIKTSNSTVRHNELFGLGNNSTEPNGIGIFLQGEGTTGNNIYSNMVEESGLGAFLFETQGNVIDGDSYANNHSGGIVVNDSKNNVLTDLQVKNNGVWGVRFVHSEDNTLQKSWIEKNGVGGVELVGSGNNKVDSNIVYDNGTDVDSQAAQIALTKGEKAIERIEQDEMDYTPEEFVLEKEKISAKLDLLDEWLVELDEELLLVKQDLLLNQTNSAMARLRTIVAEIDPDRDGSVDDSGFGKISIGMDPPPNYVDEVQSPSILTSMMKDPTKNFTLEGADSDFDYQGVLDKDDMDKYAGGTSTQGKADWGNYAEQDGFNVDYAGGEYSWDKLSILHLITDAAQKEFYNGNFLEAFEEQDLDADPPEGIDSLWEKVEYFKHRGWITQNDVDGIKAKIFGKGEAEPTTISELEGHTSGAVGALTLIDDKIFDENVQIHIGEPDGTRTDIFDHVVSLYQDIINNGWGDIDDVQTYYIDPIEELKSQIRDYMELVDRKLCEIDLELPPFPEVETTLAEKKEKPFDGIIYTSNGSQEFPLHEKNGEDDPAQTIGGLGTNVSPISVSNSTEQKGVVHSENNEISSNLITTDQGTNTFNAGILLESGSNTVVNNTITNERVKPIDDSTAYGEEFHALDVGIYLLSNDNKLAYNAIEFVNTGIIRGGGWPRPDYQVDYNDASYAEVAYWPGPGLTVEDDCTMYEKEHFDERTISWIPVHTVSREKLDVGYDEGTIDVKRNKLALNFFDHGGRGIDIVLAQSNQIFGNLFYRLQNSDIRFNSNLNIVLNDNDHYGVSGTNSINNTTDSNVDASSDYTPAEGESGHTTVKGDVSPPAASSPQAYDNFGTSDKFDQLGISSYFPGTDAEELLPPNLDQYLRSGVVLPEEKPRHPEDIFGPDSNGGGGGDEGTCFAVSGDWNLISMPVEPSDTAPSAVFDEVPGDLFLWEYANGGWNTVQDGTLTAVDSLGGYYLWLPSNTGLSEVCTTGSALTGNQSIDLGDAGWQLFGVPYEVQWGDDGTIGLTDGTDNYNLVDAANAGWVNNQIWEYNASTQSFETATISGNETLQPGKGYWIYTSTDDLTLTFSETGGPGGGPPSPTLGFSSVQLKRVAKVESSPPVPGEPAEFSVDALQVKAVSQAGTVTFQVSGEGAPFVDGVRVEVFDAAGRKIKTLESGGNSVDWSTSSVANGVYLYAASVNDSGAYVQTNIGKLLLLK